MAKYKVLKEKVDKLYTNDIIVESGELADEIGKHYQKSLEESFEYHAQFKKDKIYFLVTTKKDSKDTHKITINVVAMEQRPPLLIEGVDLWEYDYIAGKSKLLWVVPALASMKGFLTNEATHDKNIIKWIRDFLKQENIDLKKLYKS